MNKLFKLGIGFMVIGLVLFGGYKLYCSACTKTLYTKIVDHGTRITGEDKLGKFYRYIYNQESFDEQGMQTKITFNSEKQEDKPLKLNSYLKITYSKNKGVNKWEEIKKEELPKAVLNIVNSK
ncbi:MAG: YxeA family protein [Erysipelotrichales bacterium]